MTGIHAQLSEAHRCVKRSYRIARMFSAFEAAGPERAAIVAPVLLADWREAMHASRDVQLSTAASHADFLDKCVHAPHPESLRVETLRGWLREYCRLLRGPQGNGGCAAALALRIECAGYAALAEGGDEVQP